jgi:hypothetical protein
MGVLVAVVYDALRARGLSNTGIVSAIRTWFRTDRRREDELMEDYQVTGAEAALLYLYAQRRKRKRTEDTPPYCS